MIKSKEIGYIATAAILGGAFISCINPLKAADQTTQDIHLAMMVAKSTTSALAASVIGSNQGYCWRKVPGTLGNVETLRWRKSKAEMQRIMADEQYKAVMRVSFKYLDMKFTEQGMTMFNRLPDAQNRTPDRILVPFCPPVQTPKP